MQTILLAVVRMCVRVCVGGCAPLCTYVEDRGVFLYLSPHHFWRQGLS